MLSILEVWTRKETRQNVKDFRAAQTPKDRLKVRERVVGDKVMQLTNANQDKGKRFKALDKSFRRDYKKLGY